MKKILTIVMFVLPLAASAQQVEKLQKKVDKGDTKAMRELAAHYEAGFGLPVDTAKALELYRRADALGNADARGDLSRLSIYYSAQGHDSTECYRLAKASADAGSPYGTYRLAVCYLDGIGVQRDPQRFRELNEKAIAMGCDEALSFKGRLLLFGSTPYPHDVPQAFRCLKKVKGGSCHSQKYTGLAQYYQIVGDQQMAVKNAREAAARGQVMGEILLARYQNLGYGMEMDEQAALDRILRLKEKFHNEAVFKMEEALIRLYATDTTLRDKSLALRLYEEVGDEPGYSNLDRIAVSYIYGEFTPVDTAMAYRYWLRGARKKDESSIENLCRYFDIIGNQDSVDYYCRMAYELERPMAALHLSEKASSDENYESALRYALQGADWGDEELRVSAGRIYMYLGDTDKARECFEKATANGNNDAYVFRAYMAGNVDGNEKQYVKLLETGGSKGSSDCWLTLGDYNEHCEKPDFRKAAQCYEKAGNPQGDYQLARLYINGNLDKDGSPSDENIARGRVLLLRSARAGNRDGRFWLAHTYKEGIGCEENYDSANYWYGQLADEGDGEGNMQMAFAYEAGRGVPADTAVAMQYYERAGSAGISNAYSFLADFYRDGFSSMAPDSVHAFQLYQQAAAMDGNNTLGLYNTGLCLLHGIGTSRDTAAAFPFLLEAANDGLPAAQSIVGDYYNYGWGSVVTNGDSAIFYYHEASMRDDPHGDYMMGSWFYDQELYDNAMAYLMSAASNGDDEAYVTVALAMLQGHAEGYEPEAGVDLLEKVAPSNPSGRAYLLLSTIRLNGYGRTADTALALRYLDSAIALGNTQAMMTLGNLYAAGEVVPQDTVKTLELYNRAVAAGSLTAMKRLAGSHMTGEVVPLDKNRAVQLYQMAADRGDLEALCRLGLCYEEGEGVILNSRKAYNLYMQAAERGSAYGMYLVAMCYVEGVYVKEDMEQAAQWFLKSAEAGSVQSCYYIGQLYAKGEGVKKNKKEAKRWLTIAAENGMEAAEQALREL